MEYYYEWDINKEQSNVIKHGIEFAEARTVFKDIFRITRFDEGHSDEEERLLTLGYSINSRVLLVVHTEWEQDENNGIIRIISCRKATAAERRNYERKNR